MSHNTLLHQIVRPLVRRIAPLGVSPNQITTVRLVTGRAAAFAFAQGTYGWMCIGGGVFVLSMLLDRADGELARQTGQMSEGGHRYDLACDCIASIAAFIGLGIGAAADVGQAALWIGALAALGVGTLFYQLNVQKAASVGGLTVFGGRVTVDPDDAMAFVPILIWCGLAWPMVIVAAAATSLGSLSLAALSLRRSPGEA